MIYTFECTSCASVHTVEKSMAEGPPKIVICSIDGCRGIAYRVWEMPEFICKGDPDEIPVEHRTADVGGGIGADGSLLPTTHAQVMGPSKERARRRERGYQDFIDERRRLFREEGQEGAQMTHQVPIELYHGKIKQTGDKDYWRDESNLKRHKSCKVS